ncbi:MAG: hypothetical protein ACYDBB_15715 [Armatimonadota bacterium]
MARILWGAFLLCLLLCPPVLARAVETTGVIWQEEGERLVQPGWLKNLEIITDPMASGGKAVRIPYKDQGGQQNWVFSTGKVNLQGKAFFTLYVRGEGMPPISQGVALTLTAHNNVTNLWQYHCFTAIKGVNLKPEGYAAITLPLDISLLPDTYSYLSVLIRTPNPPANTTAALILDKVEVRTQNISSPLITDIHPAKIRFIPGETAAVTITMTNPTGTDFTGTLIGEERLNFVDHRPAFTQPVTLRAGETQEVAASWKLGREEYGREIAVELHKGDAVVDTRAEFFSVSSTPRWLSIGGGAAERSEYWDWAPGDLADLAPDEIVFCSGQGVMFYRTRAGVKMDLAKQKAAGIWPESYVNGTAWGEAGYKLFARRPEWFVFDSTGEVAGYDMQWRERFAQRHSVEFDPKGSNATYFFQGTLNHTLPQVQEFIARQFIKSAKEYGFKGARLDVRYLEVHPGEYDFTGKEIAPTNEQADRLSAAAIKRVKELVHKEVPDFTFGYNYASPEEVKDMPLTMKERCADGGWMLDEISCTYQEKTSPYHVWSVFGKRMVSWGDQVNKMNGIYNPFDFRREGGKYAIDRVYSTIFRVMAGGRSPYCNPYYDARIPFGNIGRLVTRYSECFFGRKRDWIAEVKGEVDVRATAQVWWKDFVYWNRDSQGRRQLIVNLVNPPAAAEVEENPLSTLTPPVRNIEVTCAPVDGKKPIAAYLLMAEPFELTEEPAVRMMELPLQAAPGGKVRVTVPSVLFWKLVVFQY